MNKKQLFLLIALVFGAAVGLIFNIEPCYGFKISIYDDENHKWYHLVATVYEDDTPNVRLSDSTLSSYYRQDYEEWYIDEKGRVRSQADSGSCMEVNNIIRGSMVELRRCSNSVKQKWNVAGLEIRAFSGSDFCLDVPGRDFKNGQRLQIWSCNSTSAQKFHLGSFTISTVEDAGGDAWYLDVDPVTDKLALVHDSIYNRWDYNGWFLDDQRRIRESNFENECLDYPWGGYLYTHKCHNDVNQKWSFSNGEIRAFGESELCVDVPRRNFVHGQEVQLWPCNGTIAQKWIID